MKTLFKDVASVLVSLLVIPVLANAAELEPARVTQIVKDVKLLPQQAAPRPASLSDLVREGTAVRTGGTIAQRADFHRPDDYPSRRQYDFQFR